VRKNCFNNWDSDVHSDFVIKKVIRMISPYPHQMVENPIYLLYVYVDFHFHPPKIKVRG